MKDLNLAIYVILMAVAGFLAVKFLGAAIELIVALFGALGTLLTSVFKFSADRLREQENEALKIKRANYQKLLLAIGKYAANTEAKHELVVAHTESWAFAESEVVKKTGEFLQSPDQQNLKEILIAMRSDVGLPELKNIDELVKKPISRTKNWFSGQCITSCSKGQKTVGSPHFVRYCSQQFFAV